MYLMLSSKKGMSALQIQRMMGMGSYHTAHKMCMKIRVALGHEDFRKLSGFVEVDETYIGGRAKNKHRGPGGHGDFGGPGGANHNLLAAAAGRHAHLVPTR